MTKLSGELQSLRSNWHKAHTKRYPLKWESLPTPVPTVISVHINLALRQPCRKREYPNASKKWEKESLLRERVEFSVFWKPPLKVAMICKGVWANETCQKYHQDAKAEQEGDFDGTNEGRQQLRSQRKDGQAVAEKQCRAISRLVSWPEVTVSSKLILLSTARDKSPLWYVCICHNVAAWKRSCSGHYKALTGQACLLERMKF